MTYLKLFLDWLDAMEPLGDAERGRLLTALMKYARTGEAPQLDGNERFLFPMMRLQVDRDKEAEERISESRRNAGKNGGIAKASKAKQNKQLPDLLSKDGKAVKDKDKDEDEEEDILEAYASCAAPQGDAAPSPVISLPLNDGTEYPVTQEQCQEWAGLYPAVDVIQQLRNMRGWLIGNPGKRKTQRGVLRFVTNWLAREQDRGGARKGGGDGGSGGNYGNAEGTYSGEWL